MSKHYIFAPDPAKSPDVEAPTFVEQAEEIAGKNAPELTMCYTSAPRTPRIKMNMPAVVGIDDMVSMEKETKGAARKTVPAIKHNERKYMGSAVIAGA